MSEMNSIRQTAELLGVSEMRVRTLIRDGRLEGAVKEPLAGTEVQTWKVPTSAIEAFKNAGATSGGRGRRAADGTVARKIRVPASLLGQVTELLAPLGIALEAANNYDPEKSKEYRVKRQLAQRAAKAEANAEAAADLDV